MVLLPVAGGVVALLALAYAAITGEPLQAVLLSGQDAMASTVQDAPTLSTATLLALLLVKGVAWGISLGGFRGGPTFPAIYLGLVGGLIVAAVFGIAPTPAVAAGMAATTVAMLRLPLSTVVLVMVVAQAGLAVAPLIIVATVVSYITTELLGARRGAAPEAPTKAEPEARTKATPDAAEATTST